MNNVYIRFWKKINDIHGKCSVKEYWKIMFIHLSIYIILFFSFSIGMLLKVNYGLDKMGSFLIEGSIIVSIINFLATLWPNLTITKRRLNDAGLSWVILFFIFLPFGPMIIIYFLATPTENDEWNFYSK